MEMRWILCEYWLVLVILMSKMNTFLTNVLLPHPMPSWPNHIIIMNLCIIYIFLFEILHIPDKCFYYHNLCPHDLIILLHGRLAQKGNKNQASDCFGSKHKIWCSCLNCVGADGNHVISIAPYWIEKKGWWANYKSMFYWAAGNFLTRWLLSSPSAQALTESRG